MSDKEINNQYDFFKEVRLDVDGNLGTIDSSLFNLSLTDGSGVSYVNKFGKNSDIDSGTLPEVIWSYGGLYTPPTTAQTHNVSSTSANDVGSLVTTGVTTNFSIDAITYDLTITDSSATFITDGVSSGDHYVDETHTNHSIVKEVISETELLLQPFHDYINGESHIGDSYSIQTSDSTGAAVLHIFGLDENLNEVREFLILDGTNDVSTSNSYLRINRAHIDLCGSNETNVGDISITSSVDGNVTAFLTAGIGQTQQAFYTVPSNKIAYITNVSISADRVGSTSDAMVEAALRINKFVPEGGVKILEDNYGVSLRGTNTMQKFYSPYKKIKERTDIWLSVEYSTDNNMVVAGTFDIILLDK